MTDALSVRAYLCSVPASVGESHVAGHLRLGGSEAIWCVCIEDAIDVSARVALRRGVSAAVAEGVLAMAEVAMDVLGERASVACAILGPDEALWAVQGARVRLWGHGAGRLEGSGRTACRGLLAASGGFADHATGVVSRWSGSARCPHAALLDAFPQNMCVAASALGSEGLLGGAFAIALLD